MDDKIQIIQSGLFSSFFYYITQNPDVGRAGIDPLDRFCEQVEEFQEKSKLQLEASEERAKVQQKFMEDKIQIIQSGLFSSYYYITQNPDVRRAGIDPLDHFCIYGWKEGRNPSLHFNCSEYLEAYEDVAKSDINPLLHYVIYGKNEGRSSQAFIEVSEEQELNKKPFYISDANCIALRKTIKNLALPELEKTTLETNEEVLVSIIILNRNGLEHLERLIPALYEHSQGIKYELIVVDNASTDGSVSYLENMDFECKLTIIKNKSNESFSKANNIAATHAKGKHLVLLNNNMEPLRGWLHHLIYVVETKKNIGSVGSRLIYPYKESFKKSCTIQHAGIAFKDEIGFFRPYNVSNGALIYSPSVLKSCTKSAVTAACLLVTADIYREVGGLDEVYDYGFEDVDFGLKLTQAGYQNYYCADSMLFHYEFDKQKNNNREKEIIRREANASFFREKWFLTIKQNYWKEKLFNESRLITEAPLKVAIAVTDYGPNVTAGDYFTALEVASYLEGFGWTINYLSSLKKEWYQIDDDIDVVISLLESYDLSKIPRRNTRLTTIAWARNWFDRWCEMPGFNDYDIVFASSQKACDYVREHSKQNPKLLPIASNTERFTNKYDFKAPGVFECDICFTGSYWGTPRDIMQALSEETLQKYRFNVYGANWEKFEKFKPHNKGFIAYEYMPSVYRHSKIVIDDANHVTKPYGSVNSRVFDALMSGALIITNGVEGSKDLFDGELPYYETSKELDELLDFYLDNEKARIDKVEQLKGEILKKHTYKHRTESIRAALEKRFLRTSIAIKIPAPTWEGVNSWGDYHIAVLLKKQLENEGYYVLLQILPEWDNNDGMECDVVIVLRGLSRYITKTHQINIMWNVSHPDKVTLEEYEEYDKVFIASKLWADKIAKQVTVPVETMLQCTDPERFHEPNEEEKAEYQQQLLFVGNSRNVYRKVLKDLLPTEYDLAVYGNDWEKIIPEQYIRGEYISNDELYRHYGSADILLNDHWADMREQGFVSNRIYDGIASGAFIMSDSVRDMGEIEKYICVYETPEELNKLTDYYLEHPEEREKVIKEGVKYIKNNHTFAIRAKRFSEVIQSLAGVKHA